MRFKPSFRVSPSDTSVNHKKKPTFFPPIHFTARSGWSCCIRIVGGNPYRIQSVPSICIRYTNVFPFVPPNSTVFLIMSIIKPISRSPSLYIVRACIFFPVGYRFRLLSNLTRFSIRLRWGGGAWPKQTKLVKRAALPTIYIYIDTCALYSQAARTGCARFGRQDSCPYVFDWVHVHFKPGIGTCLQCPFRI